MRKLLPYKILSLAFIAIVLSFSALGQTEELLKRARIYSDLNQPELAIPIYKNLSEQMPTDEDIYSEYLAALIANKDHKEAEKLIEKRIQKQPHNIMLLVDLGKVLLLSGKEKKAEEQFEKAIQFINGDDLLTTRLVNAFTSLKQDKFAIRTYERAMEILRNPYLYGLPLARLYAKNGDVEKAVNALLNIGPLQMPGVEDTKATMLEMFGNDPKKLQLTQKAVIKRINEQPENAWFTELLTWLYTQKNDWEGALIQIQALDARLNARGQRLLEFARTAKLENKFEISLKTLDAIIEMGKQEPIYAVARAEKLSVMMLQLENDPFYKHTDVSKVQQEFISFFKEFPEYQTTETLRDYAILEAQYVHDPQKAIQLLEKAITQPSARRDFIGRAKLQLGDYYILSGKIWDASLVYSQVDKDFREDVLGEEARFRNAKLAYYRGDFDWAQGQLSVLKASTSELIANDALYLSVLITENIPPDSILVPLQRFAYADLLLFQNKDNEAEALLDSISTAFPKHPLKDDILMLRSSLAIKHREYSKALEYLEVIYKESGKDVLGDDAVFKTAEIHQKFLKQPEEAKKFYERLILDYPGSTYVQTARVRLLELQENPEIIP